MAKVEALVPIVRDESDARRPAAAGFALMAIADGIEASADQIERLERAIVMQAKDDEDMRRLTTIPGSAPLRRRPSRRLCRIPEGSSRLATLPLPGLTPRLIQAVEKTGWDEYRRWKIRNSAFSFLSRCPFKAAAVAQTNKTARII